MLRVAQLTSTCLPLVGMILLGAQTAAAVSLEGQVREAGTRRPIPGAAVMLVDGDEPVFTDDTGTFVLSLSDAALKGSGTVVVDVDTDGYERLVERVQLRRDRDTTTIELYLLPTSMGETTVRERRSIEAVARGAHRISDREVNEMPGTYGDPAKAIENFPGMGRVLLSQGSLFIRGAGPNESAVYVDDYEVPDLYHFTGSTSVINIPFVDSVELIPGAFSARYGRSIGGIVTLQTRKLPTDDVHGFAKADVIDAGAYVGVPVGDTIAVGASARRSYLDVIRNVQIGATGTGDSVVQIPTYWDYQLKLDWDTAPGHEFIVFAFGSGDREENVADGNGSIEPFYRTNDSDFHRVSLRYKHGIGGGLTHALTIVGGYERATLNEEFGLRFKDRQSYDLQLRDEWTWRTQSLGGRPTRIVAGVDATVRHDGFQYGGFLADTGDILLPTPDLDGGVRTRAATAAGARGTAALYVEGVIEPLDGVSIVPGLRLDGTAQQGPGGELVTFSQVEPRLAGTWELNPGPWSTLARVAAGQTSRPAETEDVATAARYGVVLPVQRAFQLQGGVEQRLGDGLTMASTVFAIWRDGLITRATNFPVADRFGVSPIEGGGTGQSVGAELLVRYVSPTRAYGWLTYSIARHERFTEKGSTSPLAVDYATLSPFDTTHLLGLIGQMPIGWGFRAGARYRIATGMPNDAVIDGVFDAESGRYLPRFAPRSSQRFPFFQALDVRVDWSTAFNLFELTVYADLVNVLNLRAQEGTLYNFDFTQSQPRLGLPTIPAVGAKATF